MSRSRSAWVSTQSGVAMIIALMMSAVLGLLALQVSLVAKDHIRLASEAQDRSQNLLLAHTREAELTFALLTERWVSDSSQEQSNWSRSWNFMGQPFEIDGAKISIQDESGLMPIPQPGDSVELFADLLRVQGIPSIRAERIARDLQDLQFRTSERGQDRVPVQSLAEIVDFSDLSASELESLQELTTLFPNTHFNPDTAPEPVLKARLRGADVDTLLKLRANRSRGTDKYAQEIAAITDEFIVPSVGPALRWMILIDRGGQNYSRSGTMIVRPYSNEPVTVWSYSRLDR
jgi:type II secretory pathway component PulK